MKPSVYIETSVVGYLTSRPQEDVTVAGHQHTTKQWWSTASDRFDLFVSQLVIRECSDGDAGAVRDRLNSIERISVLPVTREAEALTDALIEGHAVPENQANDALHIALAASHGV
jgi:predicted nucleic acid-binding protein